MIMAHKNFEFLRHLIEYFTHDCYVFVHIDKKSNITRDEEACLRAMPQVSGVYRKYSVHWGGFSILKCEIFLMKEALHSCDADYFHLISGQDYPIKPLSYFLQFFEENKGKEFIRSAHIPNARWDKFSYKRFQYYYLFDYISEKSKKSLRWVHAFISLQKKLGIKRRIPDHFDFLYGSTQWFSITQNSVKIILHYTRRHPSFYRRCRFTFASEEFYIATILGNKISPQKIASKDLRFIRWKVENGNYPANLSTEHFHLLASDSKNLFARKILPQISQKLISQIDEYLLSDREIVRQNTGGWSYDGVRQYCYKERYSHLISDFCFYMKLESVVDAGCGAGFYVAALRRKQIAATGFDANPYTSILSSMLLPIGDEPCIVGNLNEDIDIEDPFDLVICMEVLSEMTSIQRIIAIANLIKMAKKYVLVSEKTEEQTKEYATLFDKYGFHRDNMASAFFNMNCRKINDNTETIIFTNT